MFIKLLVGRVGKDFSQLPNEVIEVDAREGRDLFVAGHGVPCDEFGRKVDPDEAFAELKSAEVAGQSESSEISEEGQGETGRESQTGEADGEAGDSDSGDGDSGAADAGGEQGGEAAGTFESIGIPGHAAELLRGAGIETVEAAESHPDLTKIKGIGKKTAEEIRDAIAEYRKE